MAWVSSRSNMAILKQKMDDDRMRSNTIERRAKSTSGLTADDFNAFPNTTTNTRRPYREPLNDSQNMGNGFSKKRTTEDRGRKQRSAAERLVDSRKSARNNNGVRSSMPKRSRSVGDRLASTNSMGEQKSLENIPAEIREQFNPAFAQELSQLVRQKSRKREEDGFQEPSKEINNEDFHGALSTLSRRSEPRRKSSSNVLKSPVKSQENLAPRKSAYETLYSKKATPGKPPRSKSTSSALDPPNNKQLEDMLGSEVSYAGTNNSSQLNKSTLASQESVYDNVPRANPPTKRTDQPPPKQQQPKQIDNQTLSRDLKTATMILRKRYNDSHAAEQTMNRTLPIRTSVHEKMAQQRSQQQQKETLNESITLNQPDQGRLYMRPGKQPLLHCRNTTCTNSATLEYAQKNYKSCVHCFTYYCCARCRQEHWQKHKEKCIYARAVSTTKAILRHIFQDRARMSYLAELAQNYAKTEHRGALQLCFNTLNEALMYIQHGRTQASPGFIAPSKMDEDMKNLAMSYRPEAEFILDVKIIISPKERLLYNRPYKTMVNHVSTAARLPIRHESNNGMIV